MGSNGHDRLYAESGNDIVRDTSTGDDRLDGGEGKDVITNSAGRTYAAGSEGDDHVITGASINRTLLGEGNNVARLGGGSDIVRGGEGNDFLDGGARHDTMVEGKGADVFVVNSRTSDRITDFHRADDTIRISGSSSTADAAEPEAFFLDSAAWGSDASVVYDQDSGRLFYDGNGAEAGGRTLLTVIENKAQLNVDNLVFI